MEKISQITAFCAAIKVLNTELFSGGKVSLDSSCKIELESKRTWLYGLLDAGFVICKLPSVETVRDANLSQHFNRNSECCLACLN